MTRRAGGAAAATSTAYDRYAALPTATYTPAYSLPTGTTHTVSTAGTDTDRGTDLQSKLNAAVSGDVIVVPSGFTYEGLFTIPSKSGSTPIYVVSSTVSGGTFGTVEGNRATTTTGMPKLQHAGVATTTPLIGTTGNSRTPWRFVGIHFAVKAGATTVQRLVSIGNLTTTITTTADQPGNYTIDRCYVEGLLTTEMRRGIEVAAENVFITGTTVINVMNTVADSIGIWLAYGAKTVVVHNCDSAGATECFMIGGEDRGAGQTTDWVVTDVTVRKCRFRHLDTQRPSATYALKNAFETKQGRRILFEDILIENIFQAGDNQQPVNIKSQPDTGNTTLTEDVTVRYVKGTGCGGGGVSIRGFSDSSTGPHVYRVSMHDLVFQQPEPDAALAIAKGINIVDFCRDVTIDHITVRTTDSDRTMGVFSRTGGTETITNFELTNSILEGDYGVYSVGGGSFDSGLPAWASGTNKLEYNALIGRTTSLYPTNVLTFPANVAAVGFENSTSDLRLASGSAFKNAGSDGADVGARVATINTRLTNVDTGALI